MMKWHDSGTTTTTSKIEWKAVVNDESRKKKVMKSANFLHKKGNKQNKNIENLVGKINLFFFSIFLIFVVVNWILKNNKNRTKESEKSTGKLLGTGTSEQVSGSEIEQNKHNKSKKYEERKNAV